MHSLLFIPGFVVSLLVERSGLVTMSLCGFYLFALAPLFQTSSMFNFQDNYNDMALFRITLRPLWAIHRDPAFHHDFAEYDVSYGKVHFCCCKTWIGKFNNNWSQADTHMHTETHTCTHIHTNTIRHFDWCRSPPSPSNGSWDTLMELYREDV